MSELHIAGEHIFINKSDLHWNSIDDFEAWMIRCHNELQAAHEDNDVKLRRQTEQQHGSSHPGNVIRVVAD